MGYSIFLDYLFFFVSLPWGTDRVNMVSVRAVHSVVIVATITPNEMESHMNKRRQRKREGMTGGRRHAVWLSWR